MQTRVAAIYVHGPRGTRPQDTEATPMLPLSTVQAVTGMGLEQDKRYFRKGDPGRERPRQVSLIDEGTISRLEARFGQIDRSLIKAQIILAGDVFLPDLVGVALEFRDGAELTLSKYREPCYAMDLIKPGLQAAMESREQGVLARVTQSGPIEVGQIVQIRVGELARQRVASR